MTAALEGGEWSAARPGRALPPGKTLYPLYRRLGGPQGRSGQAENHAPPGFDPRTVQPVAQPLYRLSYPAPTLYTYESYFDRVQDICFHCFPRLCSSTGMSIDNDKPSILLIFFFHFEREKYIHNFQNCRREIV